MDKLKFVVLLLCVIGSYYIAFKFEQWRVQSLHLAECCDCEDILNNKEDSSDH